MSYHIRNMVTDEVRMDDQRFDYSKKYLGLSKEVRIYKTFVEPTPEYEPRTHYLKKLNPVWTDEIHPDENPNQVYKYTIGWEKHQKTDQQIIIELNNSVGEHIDAVLKTNGYDRTKKIRDSIQGMQLGLIPMDTHLINYAFSIFQWADQCRDLRDDMEAALLDPENPTLPDFQWPPVPYASFDEYMEQQTPPLP